MMRSKLETLLQNIDSLLLKALAVAPLLFFFFFGVLDVILYMRKLQYVAAACSQM